MRRCIFAFVSLVCVCACSALLLAETVESQVQPIQISTITDSSNQASAEMMSVFRKKIASHPGLFSLASNLDESMGLVFTADCKTRNKNDDAYVCFYTSQRAAGAVKTFLGSGVYAAKAADDVADHLLAFMAQDIAERWNSTIRSGAVEVLQSCLFLAKCVVPEPITPELRSQLLSLSQSLQNSSERRADDQGAQRRSGQSLQ